MSKGPSALTSVRREEIVNACASLYETMNFKDITLGEIGKLTTFSRPSIYNYFQTKEEIFLALHQKEYELWAADLEKIAESNKKLTVDQLAQELAHSLERRERLLKLMSMNHYDMEANSRLECLADFKRAYGQSMRAITRCLDKFCPQMTAQDKQDFVYAFFPFVYGIYPYTAVTEKQREALKAAGIEYAYMSIYEMAYACAKKLLKGQGMMAEKTVDFHAHPVTEAFRESMAYLGIDPVEDDGFPLPAWSADAHLEFMREAGIDYTVLSAPAPHIHNGDDERACEAARRINLDTAEICKKYPEAFGFAACVPLPCVSGSIDEAAFAMDELGALGVKVATNSNGVYLGDKSFDPFMEELNRRRALVIIHPCRARQRPENVITGKVAAIYEYPADTTRAVLNMMANRVMTRFPNIRFVAPHTGSFLPYMLQRFSGVSGILASLGMMETVDARAEFERLYFDIAGDPEPVALDMLLMVADAGHIVYGSDFPHSPAKVVVTKKRHLENNEKYSGLIDKIYCENAKKLIEGWQ